MTYRLEEEKCSYIRGFQVLSEVITSYHLTGSRTCKASHFISKVINVYQKNCSNFVVGPPYRVFFRINLYD